MMTTKLKRDQAVAAHPLAEAVIEQHGGWDDDTQDTFREIAEHGADAGWGGFCYYSETCEFVRNNRPGIAAAAEDTAESLGEGVIDLVRGFNCIDQDEVSQRDVALALYSDVDQSEGQKFAQNALAWFALEEVARAITDLAEEGGES